MMKNALIARVASFALLLTASACGGGGDQTPSTSAPSALPVPQSLPHPITQTVAAIKAALGDRAGAAAVLRAADKGYSIQQISSAGVAGRLTAQGLLQNASGGTEAPAGRPTNKFSSRRAPEAEGELRVQALSLDLLGDILNDIGGPSLVKVPKPVPPPPSLPVEDLALDDDLTTVTIALLAMGYDIDQISEAVVFGDYFHVGWGVYLVAGEKGIVCPRITANCNQPAAKEALDAFLPGGLPASSAQPTAPPQQPTQAPAANAQCVRATAANLPSSVTVLMNDTTLCFVRGGGPIMGRMQLRFSTRDADCEGTFNYDLTLDGTYASPILSGKFSGLVRTTLTGECRQERAIFTNLESQLDGAWEGTLDGASFKGTLYIDPEDKEDVLVLDGRLQ